MLKHPIHRLAHLLGQRPTELVVLLHQPQQMPPLVLACCGLELLAGVQDAQVVEELEVACLELELERNFIRNAPNDSECFFLVRRQRAERPVARVAGRPEEGADAVVADQPARCSKSSGRSKLGCSGRKLLEGGKR